MFCPARDFLSFSLSVSSNHGIAAAPTTVQVIDPYAPLVGAGNSDV